MSGALDGIRVINFGQYLAGPLAALLLADDGARQDGGGAQVTANRLNPSTRLPPVAGSPSGGIWQDGIQMPRRRGGSRVAQPGCGARREHTGEHPRSISGKEKAPIAGGGEQLTLRAVARLADACNIGGDAEMMRNKLAVLRGHCDAAQRDYATIETTHNNSWLFGRDCCCCGG
jgi:hypothetical protein